MTDVSEEYARRMGESTEGMTPLQRATAYEVEAAQLIDKVTGRGYWSGEPSREATRLVDLLMEAAVERIEGARQSRIVAEVTAHPAYHAHIQQNRCHASGVAGICYLPYGHDGNHEFR
jgi:hypothetical protein